ncbi:hypothetical protein [Kitasatospora sp. NPDC048538]|uniref:hypothetical protein n=1 Tax=unclassified Kitasatospora TaxID=2633591 RepID=UPI0033C3C169
MRSTTTDPLDGLDAIDWAGLDHAYGGAGDVPGLLRALCGPGERERDRALGALYGNIFHQGSRYPASAVAVPFLARLAVDATLPGRAEVLGLLASLAIGYDEAHLPAGVAIAQWRHERAELAAKDGAAVLAELDAWVAAAPDEGERRVREFRRRTFDLDEHLRSVDAELGAYDAVRAEVPRLAALLADGDAGVRAATAYLLAWFPEQAPHSLPLLLALLDAHGSGGEGAGGPDSSVAATALVAVGLLGDAPLVPRLRPFLASPDGLLRWAAAVALARLTSTPTATGTATTDTPTAGTGEADQGLGAAVLTELTAAEAAPPEPGAPGVAFHEGDLRGYAAASLTLLAADHPEEALDAVIDGLARTSGPAAFAVTAAALRLAFGPPRPGPLPPFAELDERRRRLVRTLADLDEPTWRWGNFLEILRAWGLPQDRPAIRAYAGLPAA